MLSIINIATSQVRTNCLKQSCGGKYSAAIVMGGRKNTEVWGGVPDYFLIWGYFLLSFLFSSFFLSLSEEIGIQ